MPLWLARLLARALRRAGLTTSVLLGLASVLTAFSAYQATQYSERASQYEALASQATVDSVNQAQEDYAAHLLDSQIWVSIVARGDTVDDSPLGSLLSARFLAALERAAADSGDVAADGSLVLPLDRRYYDELTIESRAYQDQQLQASEEASIRNGISSRITGASLMYSAALLLLTVATTTGRDGGKLALNTAAIAIMVVAVGVGWATPLFG